MLEEAKAAEFVVGDGIEVRGEKCEVRGMLGKPFLACEKGMGLIVDKEVADNLCSLCHEETFTTAKLLLLQLTDEFDLILTDCHG